ncbi:hypothetical protein LCGC14_2932830 [marine sediment metagenome]|uniref:Uncharacterized protein n=1 Tax=marine sediment metagenome TaxID=412755 RepID=A0A0F8XKV6_9ZZZZ
MTNEQILKKAIEKAIKNGWDKREFDCDFAEHHKCPEIIIFSHDFAKAFWGGKRRMYLVEGNESNATIDGGESWKCHLQQMVLEKEPLKYIEKFL